MKKILTGMCVFLMTTLACAKPINLYSEPKADSKVVSKLDSQAGVITIFTPKNSDWVKVADPRNGNVGWIKTSEFGNTNFSFQVISSGDGARGYHVYQYGGTEAYSPQKVEAEMKKMQRRQQAIQHRMQHMMDDMFDDIYYPTPIFVPVILVPEKKSAPAPITKSKATEVKTKAASPTQPTVKKP